MIYQEWIAAYNGDWFKELVTEQIQRIDELAEASSEEEPIRNERILLEECVL